MSLSEINTKGIVSKPLKAKTSETHRDADHDGLMLTGSVESQCLLSTAGKVQTFNFTLDLKPTTLLL